MITRSFVLLVHGQCSTGTVDASTVVFFKKKIVRADIFAARACNVKVETDIRVHRLYGW